MNRQDWQKTRNDQQQNWEQVKEDEDMEERIKEWEVRAKETEEGDNTEKDDS